MKNKTTKETSAKQQIAAAPKNYIPRLKEKYFKEIVSTLMREHNFLTPMRVPRLLKISLNQGVGDAASDRKIIETAVNEMAVVAGQKPIITLAKKDISNFKIRKGVPVGVKVTLRGNRMYEFLDRLISAALPRIRDFRGISRRGFDERGNYTLGIQEQIIFPEINIDRVNKIRGMDITFVTSARNNNEAYSLLHNFGLPFRKEEDEDKKIKKKKAAAEFAPIVAVKS